VLRPLGQGGEGSVFLAEDTRMGRKVVLKVLRGEDRAGTLREARAAALVEHANVVRIYDVEEIGDKAFLAMEYVDGGSLGDRLRTGPLTEEAFHRVALDLLDALVAVHSAGALHRDIKPANVLITRDGRAKLADFGVARLDGTDETRGNSSPGTVRYMSPEQARGKRLTPRSDLYSAALTLFEARTGRPFVNTASDETPAQTQVRIGEGIIFDAPIEPPGLHAWFSRALALDPAARFEDAKAMRVALSGA
jgi:serine/threonine-protein kinase